MPMTMLEYSDLLKVQYERILEIKQVLNTPNPRKELAMVLLKLDEAGLWIKELNHCCNKFM